MKLTIWKVFALMSVVNMWAQKALSDGKVDAAEAGELVMSICELLGVKAEVKLPEFLSS